MLDYKFHKFGSGETITAVIRKLNNCMDMDRITLTKLCVQYNTLNNNEVPKQGDVVKIPIFSGFSTLKD